MSTQLSEKYVQDAFHSYLKSSLTHAKVENLLDADVLSSAEGDLMITGPALCLYFAALRCTTNPPSVPLPRSSKSSQPLELSPDNCPAAFISFLRVWSNTVQPIQSLPPEHQHDLARIICGLTPLTLPLNPVINGIAADLRAVAIEISQRRSFQDRYAADLQAALDSGGTGGSGKKASFVPPPVYDPSSVSSTASSPNTASAPLPPAVPPRQQPQPHQHRPQSPSHLSPYSSTTAHATSPSSPSSSTSSFPPRTPSPTILTPSSPAIEIIRETLYASLADILETHPSLRTLLKYDPPRAYFASVAFAILHVAITSISPGSDGTDGIQGVLGTRLSLNECPQELRPFMIELIAIGKQAKQMEDDDNKIAIECLQAGRDVPDDPRMDRARKMLEDGVGWRYNNRRSGRQDEDEDRRRSVEGRAVTFVNRVNALALGMTRLSTFRERQDLVFKVLAGIGT